MALPTTVDQYMLDGCMRCKYGATPQCKVHTWQDCLEALRGIVLSHSLTETVKWGVPAYMYQNKNVLLISALKGYCMLSFFDGVQLNDPHKILEKSGENSNIWRILKFTALTQIESKESAIHELIKQAIEHTASGKKSIKPPPSSIELPDELKLQFKKNKALEKAFFALTPGRQRGYLLFFTSAKQSATRTNRIEKSIAAILAGKGYME